MIHLLFLRSFELKFSFIHKKYLTSFCLRTSFSFCNKCWKDLWCLSRLKNVKNFLYSLLQTPNKSSWNMNFLTFNFLSRIDLVRNNKFYAMFEWWSSFSSVIEIWKNSCSFKHMKSFRRRNCQLLNKSL